jgi:hypothetical protein
MLNKMYEDALRCKNKHTIALMPYKDGLVSYHAGTFQQLLFWYNSIRFSYNETVMLNNLGKLQNVLGIRAPKTQPHSVQGIVNGINLMAKNYQDYLDYYGYITFPKRPHPLFSLYTPSEQYAKSLTASIKRD